MKKIRNRIIQGAIYLLPVYILLLLLIKLWKHLTELGEKFSTLINAKSLFGAYASLIITLFLVLAICYFFGILVRFSIFRNFKKIIENYLTYIPGYNVFKHNLESKLISNNKQLCAVRVQLNNESRWGILTYKSNDEAYVFLPNSPNIEEGILIIVPLAQITYLNISVEELNQYLTGKFKNYTDKIL